MGGGGGGGWWLRAVIGSNPTVSHQLELELELSVGLGSGWVLTKPLFAILSRLI